MSWCFSGFLWRPVPDGHTAAKHERVHIFTENSVDDAFPLQQRAFCLSFARRKVYRISKLLEQLFGEELGYRSNIRACALIALERRFVWPIKYKDGVYSERNQAQEAVVEGSQRRVGAA